MTLGQALRKPAEITTVSLTEHVPVINIADSFDDAPGFDSVAKRIGEACRSLGFLIVTGHRTSTNALAAIVEAAKAFFAQPPELKAQFRGGTPEVVRGYMGPEEANLARTLDVETPPDLSESFSINRFDEPAAAVRAGLRPGRESYFAPNVWPESIDGFKPAWTGYYREMERLARHLLRLMARALGLDKDWFAAYCNEHTAYLVCNHYPPQVSTPRPGQLRRGAHTDYGAITILYQPEESTGLQIQCGDGSWIAVPWVDGGFVINIGDLLAAWTNDHWKSTMHRVINPTAENATRDRMSIAFFLHPNFDALIQCIPTCTSADDPPRYDPVTAGEWIARKLKSGREEAVEISGYPLDYPHNSTTNINQIS